ncbi:acyl-CoA dehydrogenase [Halioglobus maricola]|uniref:Acyl-CoA dehydrogenase n=1 Tax=Halioglobus maricola TaxID=2601894 RepID=A0A5P9NIB3_9GAMM|nr:acyl-CoA dehydrogenase [Halioglobus maricola]QFU75567.1 acyl-CoA dehydrogenase [Halioglobus maricola]
MPAPLMNDRDLEFLLYELFDAEALTERTQFADHNRETFDATLNTAKTVAEKVLLPFRMKADNQEPTFDGEKVHMIPDIKTGVEAIIQSGLASPTASYETGGMQLPAIVANAASSYLVAAGGVATGYTALTTANANLVEAHGSAEQIEKWVLPMREGRFAGTMAMTEPGAGSGLADLTTSATKDEDGSYRVSGNKIYISGGDHELTENIVHLVLARVKGAPKGVKGISLFIVPKFLVNDDGSLGARNEVALAGLFHKMGGRAQTSTALNFGEQDGAIGYLVGEENKGLSYMFHMMNEARIMVGSSAATIGVAGYQYSLDYAKDRPQGRLLSEKDPHSSPVNIIEHPDIRRMLLTQKAYSEGALALCMYGSRLVDDEKTAATEEERQAAHTLLDFLTPIIKSWPSEYGPKANYYAIQVLGGAGYINEHPVEMFYRDNRLNPIHEGTTGIQSLDLLGRKVTMNGFAGYTACLNEMQKTIDEAKQSQALAGYAEQLADTIATLKHTTETVLTATQSQNIDAVFSNSVKYLDLFGHVVIAWLWLKQAIVADAALAAQPHEADEHFYRGKLQAMQYFFRIELPETKHWADIVANVDTTSYDMQVGWF